MVIMDDTEEENGYYTLEELKEAESYLKNDDPSQVHLGDPFLDDISSKIKEMTESGKYTIPDWCELDNLQETEELAPELTMCYYNNGSCVGIMCGSADYNTSINPHEIKFKCKEYGVWIVRK